MSKKILTIVLYSFVGSPAVVGLTLITALWCGMPQHEWARDLLIGSALLASIGGGTVYGIIHRSEE